MVRDERNRAPEGAPPGAEAHGNGADAARDREATLRRAEEIVDRTAAWVGHYASLLGQEVLRLAARAREEAEDIWAEAQSIRHGGRAPDQAESP
jgi:hypothetical protein